MVIVVLYLNTLFTDPFFCGGAWVVVVVVVVVVVEVVTGKVVVVGRIVEGFLNVTSVLFLITIMSLKIDVSSGFPPV